MVIGFEDDSATAVTPFDTILIGDWLKPLQVGKCWPQTLGPLMKGI